MRLRLSFSHSFASSDGGLSRCPVHAYRFVLYSLLNATHESEKAYVLRRTVKRRQRNRENETYTKIYRVYICICIEMCVCACICVFSMELSFCLYTFVCGYNARIQKSLRCLCFFSFFFLASRVFLVRCVCHRRASETEPCETTAWSNEHKTSVNLYDSCRKTLQTLTLFGVPCIACSV